jgi:hypothetical protein
MLVLVNHSILDPDAFWSIVKKNNPLPAHLTLLGVYPSTNMIRSTCLWEAASTEAVSSFLRETFGNMSKDEVFQVNEKAAFNIPGRKMVEMK